LETFEFEAEDGECELGLNCLALKQVHCIAEKDMTQAIVPSSTEEITCADFDELLTDIGDLYTHISPPEGSLHEPATDPSNNQSITLLVAPYHISSRHKTTTLAVAPDQVVQEVICAPEFGTELPLFPLSYDLSSTSQPNYHSLQSECLSSRFGSPHHSLVVRRVLPTQLVAAEQGQRHNLFQSRCKVKGQVCRFIIDGGSLLRSLACLLRSLA
jgi:hypothetical protein